LKSILKWSKIIKIMKKILFAVFLLLFSINIKAGNPFITGGGITMMGNTNYPVPKTDYTLWNFKTAPYLYIGDSAIKTVIDKHIGVMAYTAGTGITQTGHVFSHTAHTGDATGSTVLAVVKLQGYGIATTAPTTNYALVWNGTAWAPSATVAGNIYTAGTGLSLSGQTFNHLAHTGDVSGTTRLTVVALQGYPINTTGFTTGSVLYLDGTTWTQATGVSGTLKDVTGATCATVVNGIITNIVSH
jgi:hypothetical protein